MGEKRLEIFIIGISLFCLGIGLGMMTQKWKTQEEQKNNIIHQECPLCEPQKIPVLELQKIENGKLEMRSKNAEIRIQLLDETPVTVKEETISLEILKILPMLKMLPAPKNAQFVASKRGKIFYPLDAPEAFLTSPQNRIFFENEESATKAGFRRKK